MMGRVVDDHTIESFALQGRRYVQVGKFGSGEWVTATVLEGFETTVDKVYPA
jgi:hypothetical protein